MISQQQQQQQQQHLVKQPPIARPSNNVALTSNSIAMLNGCTNGMNNSVPTVNGHGPGSSASSVNGGSPIGSVIHSLNGNNGCSTNGNVNGVIERPFSNGIVSSNSQSTSPFESNILSKRFSSVNSLGPFSSTMVDHNLNNGLNNYEKWPNGNVDMFQNGGNIESKSLLNCILDKHSGILKLISFRLLKIYTFDKNEGQ